MPETVYIALGSNLGDRKSYLERGREAIARLPGTHILAVSDVEETEPLGPIEQDTYLNQMIAIETALEPEDLLLALHEIERANGRERSTRWAPRTLDLDVVRYGNRTINTPELIIPHPELGRRAFWQRELAQVGGL